MNTFLVPADDAQNRAMSMESRRAELFLSMAEVAVGIYGVSHPSIIQVDGLLLEWKEPLCILVERAFESPLDLLAEWSHDSAWYYQFFTAEYCEFLWSERGPVTLEDISRFHVKPSRFPRNGEVPTRILGPRYINTITGFQPR